MKRKTVAMMLGLALMGTSAGVFAEDTSTETTTSAVEEDTTESSDESSFESIDESSYEFSGYAEQTEYNVVYGKISALTDSTISVNLMELPEEDSETDDNDTDAENSDTDATDLDDDTTDSNTADSGITISELTDNLADTGNTQELSIDDTLTISVASAADVEESDAVTEADGDVTDTEAADNTEDVTEDETDTDAADSSEDAAEDETDADAEEETTDDTDAADAETLIAQQLENLYGTDYTWTEGSVDDLATEDLVMVIEDLTGSPVEVILLQ